MSDGRLRCGRAVLAPAGAALLASLAGCLPPSVYGVRPDPSQLASLRRGESTTSDLLLALGEPNGRGTARMERGAPRFGVWLYDFTLWRPAHAGSIESEALSSESAIEGEVRTLLLFVRRGRYEGYLWFEGNVEVSITGGQHEVVFPLTTHPASGAGGEGIPPPISARALEALLEPKPATDGEVLDALGPPTSFAGHVQLPIDAEPRTAWTYYFEGWSEVPGSTVGVGGRTFAFVYFRDGRCDGYMFVSTAAGANRAGAGR